MNSKTTPKHSGTSLKRETSHQPNRKGIDARLRAAVDAVYSWLAHNRLTRFPWAVVQTFSKANGSLLSGSMAYYTFLSFLPLLMIVGFIVGTLSSWNVDLHRDLSGAIDRVYPGTQGVAIVDQLVEARGAFGVLGFLAIVYGGSGFVGTLTACLNQMWEVQGGRNPIGQKLLNLLIVMFLGVALIGSVATTIWVTYLADAVLGEQGGFAGEVIDVTAGPTLMFVCLLVLYHVLPGRTLSWRSQLPGAVFATLGIEVIKRAFTLWAHHSVGVSGLPRSLLSAVLLLVWLGFFGRLILYGAAFNVVLDRRRMRKAGLTPRATTG